MYVIQFNIISFFLISYVPLPSLRALLFPFHSPFHPVTAIDLSRTFLLEDYTRICFALADHDSAILCCGGAGTLSLCDQPTAKRHSN